MIYWLFDFQVTEEWNGLWKGLWEEEGGKDLTLLGSPRLSSSVKSWIVGVRKALKESHCGDTIFCWFDFQAVLCYYMSKFTGRKRNIVALNVMCKFNSSIKGRLYQLLYKHALLSPHFYASVTSAEYGKLLNRKLGIHKTYELIHDTYFDSYKITDIPSSGVENNSVFMGGKSSRDWEFAFTLAEHMPDVTFNFVLTDDLYNQYKRRIKPT